MSALPDLQDPYLEGPLRVLAANPAPAPLLPPPHIWTVEEYFALEQVTQSKFEFLDGQIYSMTGGTSDHSELIANITYEIGTRIRDSDCWLRNSDMRLKINDSRYVYPDLSVVCGKAQLDDNETTLLNPIVVVEVLSPSSIGYDRATKLQFYRSIPSVQAYLIIDQSQIMVELHSRTETGWHWQTFTDMGDVIPLEALGCRLPVSPIYRGIGFSDE